MFLIIDYIEFPLVGLISLVAIRNIIYTLQPPLDSHMARGSEESATLYCERHWREGGGGMANTIVASWSPVSYISPAASKNKTQWYRPLREMADFRFPVLMNAPFQNCLHMPNHNLTKNPQGKLKVGRPSLLHDVLFTKLTVMLLHNSSS